MLINQRYPGPTIEADWGDTISALKINGPTSMNYDADLGPVLITDWYHKDAFFLFHSELTSSLQSPDSNLTNGKGVYHCCSSKDSPVFDPKCTGNTSRHIAYFDQGKTYKLSIVSTAADMRFTFWIDRHNFSVVGTDFVPIHPYNTSPINVAIGKIADRTLDLGSLGLC
ncbi:hypothetical protein FGG08_006472 [Glutinoglossum americanum]|uniref:Plastocyanin-like domain-containing protein n=1 Tax=Glutinoglossum americanum TaxID=1670608 RepID=A0A9P8I3E3_9PEZI|nr:hypothetical protein FGG08_006472 [Glutinoglossum americanum]